MTGHDLTKHMKDKLPFVVFGDAIEYVPGEDTGDPHQWYRQQIAKGAIAVNLKTEEELRSAVAANHLMFDTSARLRNWAWRFVQALGDTPLPAEAEKVLLDAPLFILLNEEPKLPKL